MKHYLYIANQFAMETVAKEIVPLGNGNINDTYLVTCSSKRYVLQKINTYVFDRPKTLMRNMQKVTEHIATHIQNNNYLWKTQHPIYTRDGSCLFENEEEGYWRMISFIEDAESIDTIDSPERAREVGRGLGSFHQMLEGLAPDALAYVLPHFHILPHYLGAYDSASKSTEAPTEGTHMAFVSGFIQQHRDAAMVLEQAKESGALPLKIMHGDPKINNIMFDSTSGQAISMIDLDTVQPGLLLYDLGDCARSSCNPWGEEERERWQDVTFDCIVFEALWKGFIQKANSFFTEEEYAYAYDAIFAITFEMGLRFFTDYLNGDIYFKISYPENNLYRALVQFRLAQSIIDQKETIKKITTARS